MNRKSHGSTRRVPTSTSTATPVDDGEAGCSTTYPYLVVWLSRPVSAQRESIQVRVGPADVNIGHRCSFVQHPTPTDTNGQLSSLCRELLIDGVRAAARRLQRRISIFWAPSLRTDVKPQSAADSANLSMDQVESSQLRAASKEQPTTKLVYRASPYNGGVVFAKEQRAKLVHQVNLAIASSKTWGEFKMAMPRAEYLAIVATYDEDGQPRPRSSAPFDPEQLPGFSDGDYPPWLQSEMDSILPRSFLERFGKQITTSLNGDYWMIPEASLATACIALGELGYDVEDGVGLNFH